MKRKKTDKHNGQLTLFPDTPDTRYRDSRGRFATPERAYADKAIEENKYLRAQVERYRRSWFAAVDLAAHWQRKYEKLQEKVKAICK